MLEPVELPLRFVVERPNKPVEHIYFPDAGLISVVAALGKTHQAEAGTVGWDQCTGHTVVLGDATALTTTYVQVAGTGYRIAVESFRALLADVPGLKAYFDAAVQAFMAQCTYTIVTNSRGKLEERLSRWLLMAHDRVEGQMIPITHDLLSVMLGVRRPGVTTALQYLEDRKAVATARGRITIRDRALLKAMAGPFYGPSETAQTRLTGWQPKQP
jgi:CRP-like cAMP-binding protein